MYDLAGRLIQVTDALNNSTTFAYDAAGNETSTTDPLNHTVTKTYDLAGRLSSITNRNGLRRDFTYDAVGRVLSETWYAADGVTVDDTLSYTYNLAGQLLTASNGLGAYTFGYDAAGRVISVDEPFGVSLTMEYDEAGNRTRVTDSLGGEEVSTYNAANQLLSRLFTKTGLLALRVEETYDDSGRVTQERRYYGPAGSSLDLIATTDYTYDAAGHVTALDHKNASGGNIASYAFTFDDGGQLTSQTDHGVTKNYTYDDQGQVTGDGTSTYSYDANGNRTMAGYQTGDGNQLLSDGTWNYTYDNEGNVTKKVRIANGLTWTYGYDQRNHLVRAERHTTDGGYLELSAEYRYDAFGNRAQKSVDADGAGAGAAVVTNYALDGWKRAASDTIGLANWDVWAELDTNGSLTTRYVRGDTVDQVFARVEANGDSFWLLGDQQNSIRDILGQDALVKDSIAYDAFGNITFETDPTYRGYYTYTSREFDVETALQFNRARYYDPTTGRWITQDPLGFDAGDSNLYRYVNNHVTTDSDPSGLFTWNGLDQALRNKVGDKAADRMYKWMFDRGGYWYATNRMFYDYRGVWENVDGKNRPVIYINESYSDADAAERVIWLFKNHGSNDRGFADLYDPMFKLKSEIALEKEFRWNAQMSAVRPEKAAPITPQEPLSPALGSPLSIAPLIGKKELFSPKVMHDKVPDPARDIGKTGKVQYETVLRLGGEDKRALLPIMPAFPDVDSQTYLRAMELLAQFPELKVSLTDLEGLRRAYFDKSWGHHFLPGAPSYNLDNSSTLKTISEKIAARLEFENSYLVPVVNKYLIGPQRKAWLDGKRVHDKAGHAHSYEAMHGPIPAYLQENPGPAGLEFLSGLVRGVWQIISEPWSIVTGPLQFGYNFLVHQDETLRGITDAINRNPWGFFGEVAGSAIGTKGLQALSRWLRTTLTPRTTTNVSPPIGGPRPPHIVPETPVSRLRQVATTVSAEQRFLRSLDVLPENSCFVAGTPLLTPDGEKAIESLKPGDLVLARSEYDVEGPIEPKVVEETFVRVSPILELRVGDRIIRTSAEHPFFERGRGWQCASELKPGDYLSSHDGRWIRVESVTDAREVTTVYNVRVADYHTYFVGSRGWGVSVWAHNARYVVQQSGNRYFIRDTHTGELICFPNSPTPAEFLNLTEANEWIRRAASELVAGNRGRFPLGETLPGQQPVGAPVVPGPHNALAMVTGRDGRIIHELTRQLISGQSSPSSFERLITGRRYRATDTEARLVVRIRLQPGEVMTILGQAAPCMNCRSWMKKAAEVYKGKYTYMWWDANNRLRLWETWWDGTKVRVRN